MIKSARIYKMFKQAGLEVVSVTHFENFGYVYELRNDCKRRNKPLAHAEYTIYENVEKEIFPGADVKQTLELWDALKQLTQDAINEAKERGEIIDL